LAHTAEMIDEGYERARYYLAQPAPNKAIRPAATTQVVAPPGAVMYAPSLLQSRKRNPER
jgi:hypothetical protein